MGVGDTFPTWTDLKDHPVLHPIVVLVLIHVLNLELDHLPVVQQVV